MINTWEHGYFQTPGLRVLYILPSSEVNHILPAKLTPAPSTFERVFVGRLEILLDTQESLLLSKIQAQGEKFEVSTLARLAYPILNRLESLATQRGILDSKLKDTFKALREQIN